MSLTIPIGGLDTAALALREGAGLPLLTDEVPVRNWLADCLQQACAERKGVILLSPHGTGKTVAVHQVLQQFEAQEFTRKEGKDRSYVPRRVVRLTTSRAASERELFVALYRAAFEKLPVERIYRRMKTDDELRDELIARCAEENVAVFVIDEAQTLTDAALDALRDLMAVSETTDTDRIETVNGVEIIRPGGLGVLLVATMAFQTRLPTLSEYGRRWVRLEQVRALDPAAVPSILAQILPAFGTAAKALGSEAWASLVGRLVTQGHRLPIATLHDLARTYIRRASAENPKARKVAQVGWDAELFEQAVYEHVGFQILGQDAA